MLGEIGMKKEKNIGYWRNAVFGREFSVYLTIKNKSNTL